VLGRVLFGFAAACLAVTGCGADCDELLEDAMVAEFSAARSPLAGVWGESHERERAHAARTEAEKLWLQYREHCRAAGPRLPAVPAT
jgi:hypothetical protein